MENKELLNLVDISKTFISTKALDKVHFKLNKGEIVGLLGENGAGKSTLVKIINGIYYQDEGEIYINSQKVKIKSPKNAIYDYKIGYISQKDTTYHYLTVAENIFMGDWASWSKGVLNWKKVNEKTKNILARLNLNYIKPTNILSDLAPGIRQMIEVATALHRNINILIMDEPTSSLTNIEKTTLFNIMSELKKAGMGIIFISHFLDEVFVICDKVFVLKDGKNVLEGDLKDISRDQVIKKITGQKIMETFRKEDKIKSNRPLIEVKNLSTAVLDNISFKIFQNEIFGITGLMGAGKSEVGRAIYGLDPINSGKFYLKEKEIKTLKTQKLKNLGLGYLSEDKEKEGIIPKLSVSKNITLSTLKKISHWKFIINLKLENVIAKKYVSKIHIMTPSLNTEIENLSGGNQQKVVIARWLADNSEVLILDEPTKGIDVGAKNEIYNLIFKLIDEGKTIILISSELKEIISMCDRYIIIRNGKIYGEYLRGYHKMESDLLHELNN